MLVYDHQLFPICSHFGRGNALTDILPPQNRFDQILFKHQVFYISKQWSSKNVLPVVRQENIFEKVFSLLIQKVLYSITLSKSTNIFETAYLNANGACNKYTYLAYSHFSFVPAMSVQSI